MSEPLGPDQERLLAAVVALETSRAFDGNEPAAQAGLAGQLIDIRCEPSDDPWTVPLVVHDATPVALSDGPLLGRYWIGEERRGEVVVRVRGGALSSMAIVWAAETPEAERRWPEPGDLATN